MKMVKKEFEEYRRKIEERLEILLPPAGMEPRVLHRAMRYSVLSGGKRLRPVIVLASGDIAGVDHEKLMPAACGLEILHNFSLVHDDLPAMDNDDYRRGKLTCHKKFGEDVAILAGDALLTLAFEAISETGLVSLVKAVARATGSLGMAGGQVLDMKFKDRKVPGHMKKKIDVLKTGCLFKVCFEAPLHFRKVSEKDSRTISRLADNFGQAFQVRDDIEDNEGDASSMKKKLEILYGEMKRDICSFGERGKLLGYINERLFNVTAAGLKNH